MKILILQQEYLHISRIKMWNYWCNLGLYQMLTSIDLDVDVIYIPHFKIYKDIIEYDRYDYIIINDIVHGLSGEGPVVNLDKSDMDLLVSQKIPLCGVAVESIYTYYNGDMLHDFAIRRLEILKHYMPYFSSFLCSHIYDAKFLNNKLSKHALWLKPVSFDTLEVVSYGKDGDTVFNGSLYPERVKFVNCEAEQGLAISQITLPQEDLDYWLPIINNICDLGLRNCQPLSVSNYQKDLVVVNNKHRIQAELNLIKALSRYKSVVHLPAFFKGCHPRVIQALQASATPFTPRMSGIDSLWLKDGIDCIYYDPENSGDLTNKVRNTPPGKANEIIMNGRERNSTLRNHSSLAFEIANLLDSTNQ